MISRAAPEFWQLYRELPPEIRAAARSAYQLFSQNPAHPGLPAGATTLLIRVPGLFASRETFEPSHFAAATSGFGSGLARTKSSTADYHGETSRVERSDLRGVVGVNQGVIEGTEGNCRSQGLQGVSPHF